MDLSRTIQELHAERKRLVDLIRAIEEIQRCYVSMPPGEKAVRRRGRKSMGTAERQQVSERMKKYWAIRRSVREGQEWAATG